MPLPERVRVRVRVPGLLSWLRVVVPAAEPLPREGAGTTVRAVLCFEVSAGVGRVVRWVAEFRPGFVLGEACGVRGPEGARLVALPG